MTWRTDLGNAKVGHRYQVTVELPRDGRMVVHAMRGEKRWVPIGCVSTAIVIAFQEIPEPYRGSRK